ncbi:MAG TPA: Ig-like domain-containing protein [Mycobacteriales bacterium]|nr:Ig-like domain-containing protein [Mycobacteriales bacterium]
MSQADRTGRIARGTTVATGTTVARGTTGARGTTAALAAIALGALVLSTSCSANPQHKAGAATPHHSSGQGADPSPSASATKSTPAPPAPAALVVHPVAGTAAADPTRPITVSSTNGTLSRVVVTNPVGDKVIGKVSSDRRTWTSAEDLGYGKAYKISAIATNSAGKATRKVSSFTTVTPANQTAATIFPATGTSVGVGTIIDVNFDEVIGDKAAAEQVMKVSASPATVGSWHWMGDKEAEWRPAHFWKPGTKISVDLGIYGAQVGDGLYGQADAKASYTVHDDWRAVGNVNTYNLTVYHNGAKVKVLPVSYGKPATPTHSGWHVIYQKYPVYLMNSASYGVPADSPGGYANFKAYWAMRISGDGEFDHANEGTVGNQGYSNVSHGCINLSLANSQWLYDHMGIGDPENIIGGDPQLPIDDGYGGWNVSYAQWQAGSALRH